jgi:hypothetical protein
LGSLNLVCFYVRCRLYFGSKAGAKDEKINSTDG